MLVQMIAKMHRENITTFGTPAMSVSPYALTSAKWTGLGLDLYAGNLYKEDQRPPG